ncbi:6075_t:CDS:2 [Diversispora eburnea]|uniref:6075_t:CDS:1 n=1 Tax=Diversispora eburnea TaxID=1213867 RepID=A0A9N8UY72_9GLOM|nr:6075_t:CDS:2 [Diversispora eburnea]
MVFDYTIIIGRLSRQIRTPSKQKQDKENYNKVHANKENCSICDGYFPASRRNEIIRILTLGIINNTTTETNDNTHRFRSIIVQTPVESSQFNIGSTQIVKWKTEVVIEILSSPRFELNPPEMVWKTTARVSDGQVKFVVGHWSYLNIFFAKVYTQGYPRIYGTSEHFTIYSLPIPT